MANVLTGMRIVCGLLILYFPAFCGWYYFLYLLGGFSDAIDGTVARKTGTASDFGSIFDTVADFIFTAAVGIKTIRALYIPEWLEVWIAIIASIKIGSHLAGYVKHHKFKTVHSVLNKVCGGIAFVVPLFIGGDDPWQAKTVVGMILCIFALIAAIAEGMTILGKK